MFSTYVFSKMIISIIILFIILTARGKIKSNGKAVKFKEELFMTKSISGIMTGIGVGIAAGCAGAAIVAMSDSSTKRMLKKKANKALKVLDSITDDIQDMFK